MSDLAIHEAAHCVAAHLKGQRCDSVSIVTGPVAFGGCKVLPEHLDDDADTRTIEGRMFIHLAGPMAQERISDEERALLWASWGRHDLEEARTLAMRLVGEAQAETKVSAVCAEVKEFLDEGIWWDCVVGVAIKLDEERNLSGDDVAAVISAILQ